MKKIGTKEQRQKIRELLKEADDKGFKKGTFYIREEIYNGKLITQEEQAAHRAELFHVYDDQRGITLTCGPSQGLIYKNGNWTVTIDKKKSVKFY